MIAINKSVAAAGFEMPFGKGICTISESSFSTSIFFGRDLERKTISIKITEIHIKILRGIPYLPSWWQLLKTDPAFMSVSPAQHPAHSGASSNVYLMTQCVSEHLFSSLEPIPFKNKRKRGTEYHKNF